MICDTLYSIHYACKVRDDVTRYPCGVASQKLQPHSQKLRGRARCWSGVRHFIDVALSLPPAQSPRLIFISSVAAAGAYQGPSQAVSVGDTDGRILVPEDTNR